MSGNNCVLVVDDNRINRMKLLRALKEESYDTCEAPGGKEALEILQSQEIHMVLLDILMPDVDGFQVLQQMQSDPQLKVIPVIMVSAVDEQEDVERCLDLGAVGYISKPFDIDDMKDRVMTHLKNP